MSKKIKVHRGRKSVQDHLEVHYGKRDFLPTLVNDTEGVTTIKEACKRILAKTQVKVQPIPLRNMVRNPKNAKRIRRDSSLNIVCNLPKGRQRIWAPRVKLENA